MPTADSPCDGRTSPVRPLGGGLLGSDGSWRTFLAVRLEGRDGRRQRREDDRGGQSGLAEGRYCPDDGRHAATAHAEVACGRVVTRGGVGVRRLIACVMVCRRMFNMHLVVSLHIVADVPSGYARRARPLPVRTQHGRRHRTPNREQDGQQNQDDDAEVLHVGDYRSVGLCAKVERSSTIWLRCLSLCSVGSARRRDPTFFRSRTLGDHSLGGESIQDGAFRSIVAATTEDEVFQRGLHRQNF